MTGNSLQQQRSYSLTTHNESAGSNSFRFENHFSFPSQKINSETQQQTRGIKISENLEYLHLPLNFWSWTRSWWLRHHKYSSRLTDSILVDGMSVQSAPYYHDQHPDSDMIIQYPKGQLRAFSSLVTTKYCIALNFRDEVVGSAAIPTTTTITNSEFEMIPTDNTHRHTRLHGRWNESSLFIKSSPSRSHLFIFWKKTCSWVQAWALHCILFQVLANSGDLISFLCLCLARTVRQPCNATICNANNARVSRAHSSRDRVTNSSLNFWWTGTLVRACCVAAAVRYGTAAEETQTKNAIQYRHHSVFCVVVGRVVNVD